MTDDTAELDDIDGVGPSYATRLRDAGYDRVTDVATATPDEIEDVLGGRASGGDIVDHAETLVGDTEHTDDDLVERVATETIQVPDRTTALYLTKGLVEKILRHTGRNEVDEVAQTQDLIDRILAEIDEDGGSVEVNLDDVSALYEAVRNVESEVQTQRGLSGVLDSMKMMRMHIQDVRETLWPDS